MSASGRFAPMTAELLARKGQAKPFNLMPTSETSVVRRDVAHEFDASMLAPRLHGDIETNDFSRPAPPPRDEWFEVIRFSPGKPPPGRRHSVSLLVTDGEFEKLGLIAVKKRVNRQQLLRLAVDRYLEKLAGEYRSDCHCISATTPCCGDSQGE